MEEILKQILDKLSNIDNRLNNLEIGQTDLKAGQKKLEEGQEELKLDVKALKEGQDLLLNRQFFLDGKFDINLSEIQNKQDKILSAVDSFVHRLVRVEDEQAIIGYRQQEHSEKLEFLESKIA